MSKFLCIHGAPIASQCNFCGNEALAEEISKLRDLVRSREADALAMRKACVEIYNKLPIPPINPEHLGFLHDIREIAVHAMGFSPGAHILKVLEAAADLDKAFAEFGSDPSAINESAQHLHDALVALGDRK